MNFKERIRAEVLTLRQAGVEGNLRVVPVVNKRCFLPCGPGRCNCISTIAKGFCLVSEDKYSYAINEANDEVHSLQVWVDELDE